jgi:uncharacterized membrane protein HdeD (DUF308 family)
MENAINKKIKREKYYIISLIVSAIGFVCSLILLSTPLLSDNFLIILSLFTVFLIALWTIGVLYVSHYFTFKKTLKTLREKGLEDVVNDIDLEKPIFPKSKIFCGEKALFSKNPWAIIPFSEIAWTYMYVRRTNGFVVERAMIIYTKENKKYTLSADEIAFKFLLISHIVKNSPNVIVGYGAEQKYEYGKICPEYIEGPKRLKRIGGIALMCLGAVLLISAIFNFNPDNLLPLIIIISLTLGGGLFLFLTGSKE